MESPLPFSVVICCADSEDTLEAACRSVSWSDDVVIVDSGSSDATPEIARRHAHRYVVEPWRGYTEQKKLATSLARHDWVLLLDSDEECSPLLAEELARLAPADLDRHDLFLARRRGYMMGRPVRSWWPDWQSRFFHRRRIEWADELLHDARLASSLARVRRLRGWLEHGRHSNRRFRDYFDGRLADARLPLVATQLRRRGRRAHWWDLALRPAGAFLRHYLLQRGFLDGTFGLLTAQKAAVAVQLKYSALWAMQNGLLEPVDSSGSADRVSPGS